MANDKIDQLDPFLVDGTEVKPFQLLEIVLTLKGYNTIVQSLMARSREVTYGDVMMHIEANWEHDGGTFRFPLTKFQEFFGADVTAQSALDGDFVSSIAAVSL